MIVNEISLVIQNKNSLARKLTAGALSIFFCCVSVEILEILQFISYYLGISFP